METPFIPTDTPEDLISPNKAARILGVHLCTIYRWAFAGRLRSWKVRQLVRVSEREVRAMLRPRRREAVASSCSPELRKRQDEATRRYLEAAGYYRPTLDGERGRA